MVVPFRGPVITRGTAGADAAGSTERKTARQIDAMAGGREWTPEMDRWEDQALTSARVIDSVVASGRVHLAPAYYRLLNDALDHLRQLMAPAGPAEPAVEDDPTDFLTYCNVGFHPLTGDGDRDPVQHLCGLPLGHAGDDHRGSPEADRVGQCACRSKGGPGPAGPFCVPDRV